MAVNLIRDARVFFTTSVDTITGKITPTGVTNANTFEFQVLDGMSFSQNTGTETVSINEAGTSPKRGQVVFNTTLEPVDFSFSTYMRPLKQTTVSTAEEKYLWNAFSSAYAIGADPVGDLTDAGWKDGVAGTTAAIMDFSSSDYNQLQKFGIIIAMKGATFFLHNCALESVAMDFGIDAIATLAWTGKATEFEQANAVTFGTVTGTSVAVTGGTTGTMKIKDTNGTYLANKLSVAYVTYPATGTTQNFEIPITAGNLTINNNLTYLTPATVGVVNKPITYFTGARTYSGSLTAYLRKGTLGDTADLFGDVATTAATSDRNQAYVKICVGGSSTTATRVDVIAPTAMLSIPTIATEQVVTATFGFTPQGSTSLEDTDELTVSYFSAA